MGVSEDGIYIIPTLILLRHSLVVAEAEWLLNFEVGVKKKGEGD